MEELHSKEWNTHRLEALSKETAKVKQKAAARMGRSKPMNVLFKEAIPDKPGARDKAYLNKLAKAKKNKKK